MAENQEDRSRDDLTDELSTYRLEDFRRRGIVSQSRELTGLAALLASGATVYLMAPSMGGQIAEFMREVFNADLSARLKLSDASILGGVLLKALKLMIAIGLPVCVAGFVLGVFSSFSQIGGIFSWDPLTPDLSKIDPLKGARKYISLKQWTDGLRLIIQLAVISFVAYGLVRTEIFSSPSQLTMDPVSLFTAYGATGKTVFLSLVGVMAIFAFIDLGMQKWEYRKNLRLTRQESKQEHKEREGDPQIKARIRSVQRELARRRMMAAVKKADVVVTNPTHIAIAIVYDKDKMYAPKVVAKGADFVAQKIKSIAAEAGVPLVENVPLARTLYKSVKINQYVPRALYQAVAEVLAYVYKLRGRGTLDA